MVELTRSIRFCLNGDGSLAAESGRFNTFASWPAMRGLGRYYELRVICVGEPNPQTGYFINITQMDTAARLHALPIIATYAPQADPPMGRMMQQIIEALQSPLEGTVACVQLLLTPTLRLDIKEQGMNTVLISQRFAFSSAHRLHVEQFSDEENRQTFGKCNNPAGHGHNYQLEVTVASAIDQTGQVISTEQLEQIVHETAIERFDHKHLNLDTAEFAHLNPSVENISMVIYRLLEPAIESTGAHLDQVKVWETQKTSCTYRGDE